MHEHAFIDHPCAPWIRRARWQVPAALLATVAVGFSAGTGSALPAGHEREAPQVGIAFRDETSVDWVLVTAVVRGRRGVVTDLEQDEFVLSVDGKPVPLASFERGPERALDLLLLQDLSGSMAGDRTLGLSRQAAGHFLDAARDRDRMALVTFAGDRTVLSVPLSPPSRAHRAAMRGWRGWGTTALHDAVARLPSLEPTDRLARQAALVVTDGRDNASHLAADLAARRLRAARLPVYALLVTPPGHPGGASTHALHRLAGHTGGRAFVVDDDRSVRAACSRIADELRHQYVLGFRTRPGPARDRRLRVEVRGAPDLSITHRAGYRGGPP